ALIWRQQPLWRAREPTAAQLFMPKSHRDFKVVAASSCNRDLSPPPRMNLPTKSVAKRVACPNGIPVRKKSLVFMRKQIRLQSNVNRHVANHFGLGRIRVTNFLQKVICEFVLMMFSFSVSVKLATNAACKQIGDLKVNVV